MDKKDKELRQKVLVILSAVVIFLLLSLVLLARIENQKSEEEREIAKKYLELQHECNDFITNTASIVSGLSAYIKVFEEYDDKTINSILHNMMSDKLLLINNAKIIECTTVKWVYPMDEYTSLIGINLKNDPLYVEKINYMKANNKILFDGLSKDKDAFIIYIPIKIDNEYWGNISLELNYDFIYEYIEDFISDSKSDYLVIDKRNQNEALFGNVEILENDPLHFVNDPENEIWDIYCIPKGGWEKHLMNIVMYSLMNILLTIAITRFITNEYNKLNTLKVERDSYLNTSIKDQLTKIYNRGYFDSIVKSEIAASDREKINLSLIYFDLDKFKSINDIFGHSIGDQVLFAITENVSSSLRENDIFARWGGDEFVVLLPFTGLEDAKQVANKIRNSIERIVFSGNLNVTVSLGVSERLEREYYDSWFRRTDLALYEAKKKGGNCLIVASDKIDERDQGIPWMDSWKCGNKIIDRQHKELITKCNLLIMQYKNDETDILEVLFADIKQHFSDEIIILRKIDYPFVKEHKRLHDDLIDKLKDLKRRLSKLEISAENLYYFILHEVVMDHMRIEDVKFYSYFEDSEEKRK